MNNKDLIIQSQGIERVDSLLKFSDRLLQNFDSILVPYRKKSKWGFCSRDRRVIISCIYDEIKPMTRNACGEIVGFFNSLSIVRIGNFFGVINLKSEFVISCDYETIDYMNGLFRVKKNGKYGMFNEDGIEVIGVDYDDIDDGTCMDGPDYSLYDLKNYKLFFIRRKDTVGILNNQGSIILPCIFKALHFFRDEEIFGCKLDEKWGFFDRNGNQIVDYKYDGFNEYSKDRMLLVGIGDDFSPYEPLTDEEVSEFTNGECQISKPLYNFISKNGELLNELYEGAGEFSEDLACVKRIAKDNISQDKWGYIDREGKEVIPPRFSHAGSFSNGLACVSKLKKDVWFSIDDNESYGFIDKTGKVIIPFIYESANDFRNGLCWVLKNSKWGLIDDSGKLVTQFIYDEAVDFENDLAVVRITKKTGVINKFGNEVIPMEYESIYIKPTGFMKVKKDQLWGLCGPDGLFIVPCEYDDLFIYKDLILVKKEKMWGIFSTAGVSRKVNFIFDSIDFQFYDNELLKVSIDGKKGFMNIRGELAISCKYFEVSSFNRGFAEVYRPSENSEFLGDVVFIGYIDDHGTEFWED